jgi:hypothetical protein
MGYPVKFDDELIKSAWYKNCKRQRKIPAKICCSCPFKNYIEWKESIYFKGKKT